MTVSTSVVMLEMYYQVPPTPLTLQEMKCINYLFTYLLFILAELRFEPAALHTPGVGSTTGLQLLLLQLIF